MSDFEVVELTFHTTHDASEILAFWLHESGALGVTIVDPEEIRADLMRPDSLDYAGKDFLDSLPETVVLTAWFYKDGEDMLIREEAGSGMVYAEKAPVRMNALAFIASIGDRLQMLHEESGEKDINLGFQSVLVVKPEDWEDNWKKYQKPLRIGERFVVVPTWYEGEVEDQDLLILFFIEAVGERCCRRLVDDAQDFETGDLTGVLGRLPLRVGEVSRHRDNGLADRFAEVAFCILFHLAQDHRGDFLRCVIFAVDRDFVVRAHFTFDRADRAVRVRHGLTFSDLTDETFTVFCERDDRRRRATTFRVRDNYRFAAFEHCDTGVRRSEIYSDDFCHMFITSVSF